MTKIKALIFDLGNVLIYFDWKIAREKLNQFEPELGEKTTRYLKENKQLIYNLECGKISEDEFLTAIKGSVNSSLTKEELAKIYSEIFWENSELTKHLPTLKLNYKLYLLSNTNKIHRKYGWDGYNFLKNFDRLFLSYEIGFAKPDREIYEFVLSNIPFKKDEIIYIDDIPEYIEAAKKLGWNAIQFKNNELLIDELRKFGVNL